MKKYKVTLKVENFEMEFEVVKEVEVNDDWNYGKQGLEGHAINVAQNEFYAWLDEMYPNGSKFSPNFTDVFVEEVK